MKTTRLAWGLALLLIFGAPTWAHDRVKTPPQHEARLIRFPDVEGHQTLVVDLHTHSVFSDGHVWPSIRVAEALRDGLDALAITEHLEWQPHRADLPHPDRNRAYEQALAALPKGSDLILIAGSEITREAPADHINAVFIKDANALLRVEANPPKVQAATPEEEKRLRAVPKQLLEEGVLDYYAAANQWPAEEAVRVANRQGAFVFWNHPFYTRAHRSALALMTEFHQALIQAGQLHGIEIANGAFYSEEAHALALEHGLTMLGVSDIHNLIDWDYPPRFGAHRPVTLAFAKERSAEGLREALFAGRTVVWFKNLLLGREAQLRPLLQAALNVTEAAYRKNLDVLDLTITNASDADIQLRNLSPYTFMHDGDDLTVPQHGKLKLSVRTVQRLAQVELEFEVGNALVAPKQRLRLSHNLQLGE